MNKDKDSNSVDFSSLLLETENNKTIQLKAESIAHWMKEQVNQEKKHQAEKQKGPNYMSRFGLKNAQDVISFLNSPAGQTTKSEIGAELSLIANIKEERRIEQLDKLLLKRRLRAYLILCLIAHKKAKADLLQVQAIDQIKKILSKKTISNQSNENMYNESQNDILHGYEAELNHLEKELEINKQEQEELDRLIAKHQEQIQDMDLKHKVYNSALQELDATCLDFEKGLGFNKADLNKEEQLESQSALSELEKLRAGLNTEIHKTTDLITEMLEKNEDSKAYKHKHHLNALHIKAAQLSDLIDIARTNKTMVNAKGKTVNSISQAEFILKPEQKLVQFEGKYYLLNKTDDFENLGPEEREEAHAQYQLNKDSLVSVKKMVLNNQQQEKDHHQERAEQLEVRREDINTHRTLVDNQIRQVQSAHAVVSEQLKNPDQILPETPRPTPVMKPMKTSSARHSSPSQSFHRIMEYLRQNEEKFSNNRNEVMNLSQYAASPEQQLEAREFIKQNIARIPPSAPIPHTTMVMLLRHLERFGIDATKPGMTNIRSQTDELTSPNPRPTNIPKPSPYGK